MRTLTTIKAGILMLVLSVFLVTDSFTQDVPPLVYNVEHTGIDCTAPPLPTFYQLPIIEPLPDPFMWSDGSGRDTTFEAWTKRRAEILAEIQNYEIGTRQPKPDTISATFVDGVLTVEVTENGQTLTLSSNITVPAGEGPFPAIIGMNSPYGSIPGSIFTDRDIIGIPYNHNQVTTYSGYDNTDPYFDLYPSQNIDNMGQYAAWSWGVSRLIDGLELVQADLPVDLERIGVTGCSYAGKMALFSGAFDERVALTIAQEPGGGGAAAWRVSETLGNVEKLGSTDANWFKNDMWQFSGNKVSRLPHDHHELVSAIAPRAALIIGNPPWTWLAGESGYVSSRAALKVWENFGIEERFGFTYLGRPNHCQLEASQYAEIEVFVDKFLMGDTTVNTMIRTHDFDGVNYEYWTDWWGKGEPEFPILDRGDSEEVWFEAECGTIGSAWNVRWDTNASNEAYVIPKAEVENTSSKPVDPEGFIYYDFSVDKATTYYVWLRMKSEVGGYTYWRQMDDGVVDRIYGDSTGVYKWVEVASYNLESGNHRFGISFRENGQAIDKICISEFGFPPGEFGEEAVTLCDADTTTVPYVPTPVDLVDALNYKDYTLGQNYPNPATSQTSISFEIPKNTYVSLKIYSILGEEVAELAGKEYSAGVHTVEFVTSDLTNGVYFYRLKAGEFSASQKMIIQE